MKKSEMGRLKAQKAHGFYDEVDEYRNEIKSEQLTKAAEKYIEPFNPDSWTGKELTDHAMQENYDQGVYITGMRKKFLQQAELINEKDKEIQLLKTEAEYWRLRCIDEAGKVTTVDVVLKTPQVIDRRALEEAIDRAGKRIINDARNSF